MSERIRESLSALMDDEAHELELERVLRHSDDPELRGTWVRYHAVRHALRGSDNRSFLQLDISARVREAIDAEPGMAPPVVQPSRAGSHSLLRPLASFAVAASVFATVLVGGQLYGLVGQQPGDAELATRASPVGMVNSIGGSAVNATYGAPALKSGPREAAASYDRMARQRLQRYMLPHAEQASLNAPRGMMPYARVASSRAEEQ